MPTAPEAVDADEVDDEFEPTQEDAADGIADPKVVWTESNTQVTEDAENSAEQSQREADQGNQPPARAPPGEASLPVEDRAFQAELGFIGGFESATRFHGRTTDRNSTVCETGHGME